MNEQFLRECEQRVAFKKIKTFCRNVKFRVGKLGGEYRKAWDIIFQVNGEEMLGCTYAEAISHIESLWEPRMSWWNYGKEWEIDHIDPLCNHDMSNPIDAFFATRYSNLKPMWKVEHRIKGRRPHIHDWDAEPTPPPVTTPLHADVLICY